MYLKKIGYIHFHHQFVLILNLNFSEWSLKVMYENETVLGTTPVGESCSPSSDTEQEKCARPTITECVDRNKYCTGPPVVSIIMVPQ